MKSLTTTFAALLFAALAGDALIVSSQPANAAPLSTHAESTPADELSAAKRYYKNRPVQTHAPRYSAYFKGSDPSLGPDGLPYRVPAHLRGQCYFDEGYGRFRACPNR